MGGVAVKVGDAAVAVAFACSSFVVCVSWIKILFFVTLPVCGTEREGGVASRLLKHYSPHFWVPRPFLFTVHVQYFKNCSTSG